METTYLNVDCILQSKQSLADIVSCLENDIFVLWNESNDEGNSIGFETKLINTKAPQTDIEKFLNMFESLPSTLLILLKNCKKKVFDVGFESGNQGQQLDTLIDATTIKRLSELGFSIGIRIYPAKTIGDVPQKQ